MRILMVGAGATGGFYGGKLVAAGRDVTFLLREGRARQVREHGLEIVEFDGTRVRVEPRIVTAEELARSRERFDLIVISTKSYQLAGAMENIAPAVGERTTIMPILNGMAHFDALDARFGAERVLGGSVRVVSYLDAEGRVVLIATLDEWNYGERSRERTPRIVAVDEVLRGAGFTATLQPDILAALWQKWILLSSMGVSCILARGTAGQIAAAPRGRELVSAIVEECAAIGAVNGYPLADEVARAHVDRLTDPGSGLTSSLYRDMMKGAPVEADHILGDLLDRKGTVRAPLVTAAHVQLKIYEASRGV